MGVKWIFCFITSQKSQTLVPKLKCKPDRNFEAWKEWKNVEITWIIYGIAEKYISSINW